MICRATYACVNLGKICAPTEIRDRSTFYEGAAKLFMQGCVINDSTWNETMKWILKAGLEYGVQVDFTVG